LYRLSVRSPQPRCLSGAARYFLRRGLGALRVGGHPSLAFSTTSSSPLLAIDINRCQSTEDSDDDAGPNHTQVYLPEQVWVSLAEERYHSQTVRNHECPTSTRECRVGPLQGRVTTNSSVAHKLERALSEDRASSINHCDCRQSGRARGRTAPDGGVTNSRRVEASWSNRSPAPIRMNIKQYTIADPYKRAG
jgi:hypothetical protein